MPTVRTVTVKPSGGDYTSLSSAEAGEQGDLPTLDRQLDIECYAMEDVQSGATLTFDGWTTDATRYIRVVVPTAERHVGVWNTSKYRIRQSDPDLGCININEDYTRLEGLQIEGFERLCVDYGTGAVAASSDNRITSCIIRKGGADVGNVSVQGGFGKVTITNCIIYGNATASGVYCTFAANACTMNCDNVTVVDCGAYGFIRDAGTLTLRNCYSGGNTIAPYNGTITLTTCAHSSSAAFSGSFAGVGYSTRDFVNTTVNSEDLHLASTSVLIGLGTNLSSTFTTDIDGATRPASPTPWDIGADQSVASDRRFLNAAEFPKTILRRAS